jgi:hypothetical protein
MHETGLLFPEFSAFTRDIIPKSILPGNKKKPRKMASFSPCAGSLANIGPSRDVGGREIGATAVCDKFFLTYAV